MSESLPDLLTWLRAAPPGTTIPVTSIVEALENAISVAPTPAPEPFQETWRERLWLVPSETRLSAREVAEAIGRPVSWVYRRTGERGEKAPLPHRKLDGELVFTAGELRAWIEGHEALVVPALRSA